MKQCLVKLELEELPDNTSDIYWECRLSSCSDAAMHDKIMEEYKIFKRSYHGCEVRHREIINPSEMKLGRGLDLRVAALLDSGYKRMGYTTYGDGLLFEKSEIYKYSDEVKVLIDNLTLEKTQKIDKLKEANRLFQEQATELKGKLRGLEGRISTANFWDKLKYLFGGCL